jgi:hypothetical protein
VSDKGHHNHFIVLNNATVNMSLCNTSPERLAAWDLLPSAGLSFGYTEGEKRCVPAAMRSNSTYAVWMAQCRQKNVIVDSANGKLTKACS